MNKNNSHKRENKQDRNSQLSINFNGQSDKRDTGKVILLKDYQEKQLEKKILNQIIRDGKSF